MSKRVPAWAKRAAKKRSSDMGDILYYLSMLTSYAEQARDARAYPQQVTIVDQHRPTW